MSGVLFENGFNSATAELPYIISDINLSYVSHFHDEVEIVAVTEGELIAVTEKSKFVVLKGDICIFMPGEIHNLISENSNREIIMKISVPKNAFSEFASKRLSDNLISSKDPSNKLIFDKIHEIQDETDKKDPGYTLCVQASCIYILFIILRCLKFEEICFDVNKRSQRHAKLLGDINEYLKENFKERISLEDAAKKIGYSKYYFSHYFKSVTNMNFIEYAALFRLQRAAELIGSSEEKINDVAYACGFNNIRSFNRMFKKFYQLTPTAYRSLYGKEK